MKICYFNLSNVGSGFDFGVESDLLIDLNELVHKCYAKYSDIFDKFDLIVDIESALQSIDIRYTNWDKILKTVIFVICGQIASRADLKAARSIDYHMKKSIKQKVFSKKYFACFLPYLLIGFRVSDHDYIRLEDNRVIDALSVINIFYSRSRLNIQIFMCAHRDVSHVLDLVSVLDIQNAKKMLNLIKALVFNASSVLLAKVVVFQIDSSLFLRLGVAPEIIKRYYLLGKIEFLVKRVNSQFLQMKQLMIDCSDERVCCDLRGLGEYYESLLMMIKTRFSGDWLEYDLEKNHDSAELLVCAKRYTRSVLIGLGNRYKYSDLDYGKEYFSSELDGLNAMLCSEFQRSLIKKVIEMTKQFHYFSYDARSIFETCFYYLAGCMAREENSINLSFERGNNYFQYHAWKMGYAAVGLSSRSTIPFLVSRRSKEIKLYDCLKYINFRQFWRNK